VRSRLRLMLAAVKGAPIVHRVTITRTGTIRVDGSGALIQRVHVAGADEAVAE
jgi:hypothetical protein